MYVEITRCVVSYRKKPSVFVTGDGNTLRWDVPEDKSVLQDEGLYWKAPDVSYNVFIGSGWKALFSVENFCEKLKTESNLFCFVLTF